MITPELLKVGELIGVVDLANVCGMTYLDICGRTFGVSNDEPMLYREQHQGDELFAALASDIEGYACSNMAMSYISAEKALKKAVEHVIDAKFDDALDEAIDEYFDKCQREMLESLDDRADFESDTGYDWFSPWFD